MRSTHTAVLNTLIRVQRFLDTNDAALGPEFVSLKMPPANITSRALVAWAGAMGKAASEYVATFASGGLDPDFLQQLVNAAGALSDAIGDRDLTRTQLSSASAGLDAEAARGRKAVKVLNALVEPKLAGDASLLSGWNTAKRFSGRTAPVASTTVDAAANGPSLPVAVEPSATPAPVSTPAAAA